MARKGEEVKMASFEKGDYTPFKESAGNCALINKKSIDDEKEDIHCEMKKKVKKSIVKGTCMIVR